MGVAVLGQNPFSLVETKKIKGPGGQVGKFQAGLSGDQFMKTRCVDGDGRGRWCIVSLRGAVIQKHFCICAVAWVPCL